MVADDFEREFVRVGLDDRPGEGGRRVEGDVLISEEVGVDEGSPFFAHCSESRDALQWKSRQDVDQCYLWKIHFFVYGLPPSLISSIRYL